ncbi:MAG: hypothetical protein QXU18_02350 [Thermoplasmatales archaeon]
MASKAADKLKKAVKNLEIIDVKIFTELEIALIFLKELPVITPRIHNSDNEDVLVWNGRFYEKNDTRIKETLEILYIDELKKRAESQPNEKARNQIEKLIRRGLTNHNLKEVMGM